MTEKTFLQRHLEKYKGYKPHHDVTTAEPLDVSHVKGVPEKFWFDEDDGAYCLYESDEGKEKSKGVSSGIIHSSDPNISIWIHIANIGSRDYEGGGQFALVMGDKPWVLMMKLKCGWGWRFS